MGTNDLEERTLAASQRPSFLKRQKEQARLARAAQKRVARQERRIARASGTAPDGTEMFEGDIDDTRSVEEAREDGERDDAASTPAEADAPAAEDRR